MATNEELEQRIIQLSNENNDTYQAHHQIARAQNTIIDVLGFTLRMLNPQHINDATLEDLRERLDNARIPQGFRSERGTPEESEVEMVNLMSQEIEEVQDDKSGSDIISDNATTGILDTTERIRERPEMDNSAPQAENSESTTSITEIQSVNAQLTRGQLVSAEREREMQKGIREDLDKAFGTQESQDESQDCTDAVNANSRTQAVSEVGNIGMGDIQLELDAQLEALRETLSALNVNVCATTKSGSFMVTSSVDDVLDAVRPIFEDWAQKVDQFEQKHFAELVHQNRLHHGLADGETCVSIRQRAEKAEAERDECERQYQGQVALASTLIDDNNALKAEVARLRETGLALIGVIDAHEISTFDCDGTGNKYCDCLERAKKKFKTLAEAEGGGK